MDGFMRVLRKKKTQWKENLYFNMKFGWQKLYKYNAEVTSSTSMLLISIDILD